MPRSLPRSRVGVLMRLAECTDPEGESLAHVRVAREVDADAVLVLGRAAREEVGTDVADRRRHVRPSREVLVQERVAHTDLE